MRLRAPEYQLSNGNNSRDTISQGMLITIYNAVRLRLDHAEMRGTELGSTATVKLLEILAREKWMGSRSACFAIGAASYSGLMTLFPQVKQVYYNDLGSLDGFLGMCYYRKC